ncbi:MAG: glycosyltransferase family 2 protein [Candidatus Lindowbacteria bacterium]|nr:glycosyltransferase family 2 protein [Candidatus Lindowbacteria bacterium]
MQKESGKLYNDSAVELLVNRVYARISPLQRPVNKLRLNLSRRLHNHSESEPLVSVVIPTYNRAKILMERPIPSILRQTYQNFEIIIVGDCCTDETGKLVSKIGDKRISFYNLKKRGKYPTATVPFRRAAGSKPANCSIRLARGDWITPLDDDDEFTPHHIEILLKKCLGEKLEFAYGVANLQISETEWVRVGMYPPELSHICHSAALYSRVLRFLRYDPNAWRLEEPGDWNRCRRIVEAGARVGFVNEVVVKIYRSHSRMHELLGVAPPQFHASEDAGTK